jgi:hypothetical protein
VILIGTMATREMYAYYQAYYRSDSGDDQRGDSGGGVSPDFANVPPPYPGRVEPVEEGVLAGTMSRFLGRRSPKPS